MRGGLAGGREPAVIPGDVVQLRIAIWDVGDAMYDSMALIDGFQWLANATLPGTN